MTKNAETTTQDGMPEGMEQDVAGNWYWPNGAPKNDDSAAPLWIAALLLVAGAFGFTAWRRRSA